MRKKFKNILPAISLKLFAVSAVSFTALLVIALTVQSYFYRNNYMIMYKTESDQARRSIIKELTRRNLSPDKFGAVFSRYAGKNGLYATIFDKDCYTEKYPPESYTGYERTEELDRAVKYWQEYADSVGRKSFRNMNFAGDYTDAVTGQYYQMVCGPLGNATYESDEEYLFFIVRENTGYVEKNLVDRFFVLILLAGVLAAVVLSYLFSAFSDKLYKEINELTAANQRLALDIDREREQTKLRRDFIANISHELKTPLAIIKCYSEALRDNIRMDKREHYYDKITEEADGMSALVRDMLDLSRYDENLVKLDVGIFDIVALTEGIAESLGPIADARRMRITIESSEDEIFIEADRAKIGQVISNFMTNAIRYGKEGGNIFVSINTDEGGFLFEVENEGRHINQANIDKIWDRFYREDTSRTMEAAPAAGAISRVRGSKAGGYGLGLAISAEILKMHGLRYGARNTDAGVVFYIGSQTEKAV